jgi:hypothetical protein
MISWLPIYSVIDARNQYVCDLLCEYMKQRLRYDLWKRHTLWVKEMSVL